MFVGFSMNQLVGLLEIIEISTRPNPKLSGTSPNYAAKCAAKCVECVEIIVFLYHDARIIEFTFPRLLALQL